MAGNKTPPGGGVCLSKRILLLEGLVARSLLEVVIVGLDVFRQVDDLAALRLIPLTGERPAFLVRRQLVSLRHFLFGEDCLIWAFGNARAAVDARIRVD